MERRGEPEPLSRAIVDQGSEIANPRPKTRAEAEFFADDSEIATKSSARWPPLARIRARERRNGQMMVDVLVFGPWPNAPRAEPRSGVATEREIFRLAKPWKLTKRGKNLDFARARSAGRRNAPRRGEGAVRDRRRSRSGRSRPDSTVRGGPRSLSLPRGGGETRVGNFPPCKALKTHKTGKESRFRANPAPTRHCERSESIRGAVAAHLRIVSRLAC